MEENMFYQLNVMYEKLKCHDLERWVCIIEDFCYNFVRWGILKATPCPFIL